jgi:hypothetical protein
MVDHPTARRRRRRASAPEGPPKPAQHSNAQPSKAQPPKAQPPKAQPSKDQSSKDQSPKDRSRKAQPAERALRDLVGGGSSQVGVDGALRARDVNRPSEQDLIEAERDLVIVRRNWKPPAE